MSQGLTDSQRSLLLDIQARLSRMTALLQEMTGTVHMTSWLIEGALWEDDQLHESQVEDALAFHLDQVHMLLRDSLGLLEMSEGYSDADDPELEYQRAFNTLANAGMLPPQQEPPALSAEPCRGQGCGYRHCVRPCGNTEPPPG